MTIGEFRELTREVPDEAILARSDADYDEVVVEDARLITMDILPDATTDLFDIFYHDRYRAALIPSEANLVLVV
jgi:hypothetical protein